MAPEENAMMLLLGRIDGKLDGVRDAMDRHFTDDAISFGKIDQRLRGLEQSALTPEDRTSLRTLERWRWKVAGMATVVGLIVGAFGKYLLAALIS